MLPPLPHPPQGASEAGGCAVGLFRLLLATPRGIGGSRWGSRQALGPIPEPSLHPVSLPNLASEKPASWAKWTGPQPGLVPLQGQGLGLAPSTARSLPASSSTPYPGTSGAGSGARDTFEHLFQLLQQEQDREGGRGRGPDGSHQGIHGAACGQAGPAPPSQACGGS